MSLLASAALALGVSAAVAQTPPPPPETPTTLVSNLDLGVGTESVDFSNDHGQAFTTGRNPGGYVVSSVAVELRSTNSGTAGLLEVSIWSADGNGRPAVKLWVLADPDSLAGGAWGPHVFTAPVGGIHLNPSTTYVLVMDVIGGKPGGFAVNIKSDGQSGQMSWSIADDKIYRGRNAQNWINFRSSLGIEVAGHARSRWEHAAAQAGLPLSDADHIHQQGQNAWRDPAARCRSRPPHMSDKDIMEGYVWHCNARTGEYVKGFFRG